MFTNPFPNGVTKTASVLKKRNVKMGGRSHKKGSAQNRKLARAEAVKIKPHVLKFQTKDKYWSAPKIATYLQTLGVKTRAERDFTPAIVRGHLTRLKLW